MIGDKEVIDFLIPTEGFLEHPTKIGDGKITLGSGLTDPKWRELYRKRGNKWSQEDNMMAVKEEVQKRRKWAEKNVPNWSSLPEASQDALLSYKYNYDFNSKNSPKLYKALKEKRFRDAAKQIDATSKDPAFKEGLEKRRKKEQAWFLSGFPGGAQHSASTMPPYAPAPFNGLSVWEEMQKNTMPRKFAEGGYLEDVPEEYIDALYPEEYMGDIKTYKPWEELSMREKADMMRAAVRNGITTLPEIREKYNEFASGGNLYGGGGVKIGGANATWIYYGLVEAAAKDGINVSPGAGIKGQKNFRVTSNYRPNRQFVTKNGKPTNIESKHYRGNALDIVPGNGTSWDDILNALHNPNSHISRWMLANNLGYLDERKGQRGAAYSRGGGNIHIGIDHNNAVRYRNMMASAGAKIPSGSTRTPSYQTTAYTKSQPVQYTGNYLDIVKNSIKAHEGWRTRPYLDDGSRGNGWRSVGWGFNDSGFRSKYPQGISNHYAATGITKAQAEEELNWFLNRAENDLRKSYGAKWDSFTDGQKAAILDTYYQQPASVTGKNSAFRNAILNGDPNAVNYLGVKGYNTLNTARRNMFNMSSSSTPSAEIPIGYTEEAPFFFTPANPTVFFNPDAIQTVSREDFIDAGPIVQQAVEEAYDPKKEARDNFEKFNMFMSFLNNSQPVQEESDFPQIVSSLTGSSSPYTVSAYGDGGSIHIRPENRGKFTALKERTGHSASWFKKHGTPAQKKMAVFALNSRHWKHGLGGNLFEMGGPQENEPTNSTAPDMKWHQWWLNNRAEQLGHNVMETELHPIWETQRLLNWGFPGFAAIGKERAAEQVNNARKYREYVGVEKLPKKYMSWLRRGYPSSMSDEEVYNRETAYSFGVTYPQKDIILYPTQYLGERAKTHERTHALEATPQEKKISSILKEEYSPETRRKEFDSYTENPKEIYARLMDFRKAYNLDPKKKVTKKDLQLWKKRGFGTGRFDKGNDIINRYRDDVLLRLFNEVAQNKPDTQESKFLAAYGGNLFKKGGPKGSKKEDETRYEFDSSVYTHPSDTKGILAEQVVTPQGNYTLLNPKGGDAWSIGALEDMRVPLYRSTAIPRQKDVVLQHLENKIKADEYVNRVTPTAEDLFAIGTLGGFNNLMPTQWGRRIWDLGEAAQGNMSWDNYINNWTYGNNGLVSDKYAQEHPYASAAINFVGDAGAFGTFSALRNLPKYAALMEAENKVAQEATALNWRDMFANSARRTRLGDVEIDNPNLLYHLDRGDGAGAFSTQGAYVEDGFLFPGTPRGASDTPYSWWNRGEPYATKVGGRPLTRLMTATEGTPGMLHVRSQNYPIGQWNGKKGFVLNSEFVSPEPVDVYNNTFKLEPGYGWRRVVAEETPTVEWADATRTPQITANFSNPDIRYLKGTDINGVEHELPIRTMRGGIEDINGNIISDEELVANWKRSQDFYKMRLRSRGAEQQGKTYTATKEKAYDIVKQKEGPLDKEDFLAELDDLGGAFAAVDGNDGYGIVTKELNTTGKQRRGTSNSGKVHEDAHLMRSEEEAENLEDIDWSNLSLDKDEAAARGTQLKSMLGIKDNTPITSKQLQYLIDNFVRLTGMDNNMHAFLNSITDVESAAKWLSKNAYSLGGALNLLGILKTKSGKRGL